MEGGAALSIPSEEDFARADRFQMERSRNLDIAAENVKRRFRLLCSLHSVYILPQRDVDFRAYVFLNNNRDLDDCKQRGINDDSARFVREELEQVGRGKMGEMSVAFEFDSDENVQAHYIGGYFDRLR